MYVCTCVYMYVCMYACIHVCMYVSMYESMSVSMYVCMLSSIKNAVRVCVSFFVISGGSENQKKRGLASRLKTTKTCETNYTTHKEDVKKTYKKLEQTLEKAKYT